jgi:TolA-binding protein
MAQTTPVPHTDHEPEETPVDLQNILKWASPLLTLVLVLSVGYLWVQNKDTGLRTEVAQAYSVAQSAEDLQAVAQAYPDQPEAPLALLQAAAMTFNDRDFETAQQTYQSFLTLYPDHPLRDNAEWGLWMCTEQLGDLDSALNGFNSVAEEDLLYPQALLAQARIQEKKESPEAALELYTQIQEDFPETPWSEQARVFGEQVELSLR